MGQGNRKMHRWIAVGLSCVLVAGLVPAASFAQGADAVGAVRGSLLLDASDAAAGDGAAADESGGDAAEGGMLVVGSEVTAVGGEGSATIGSVDDDVASVSLVTDGSAADAGGAAVEEVSSSAARLADEDADSDSDEDSDGSAPDYDGSEASYVYDEYYEQWFLVTSKGVTGEKAEGDSGYVAGAMTPAQAWLTLDEDTGELTVDHLDGGATAFDVPATVDGRPIVKVGGCGGSESLTLVTFPADSRVRAFDWGAFGGSGIASIALPDSLDDLGQGAFYNCKKLQTVVWPKNNDMLKIIPEQTFYGCSMLDDDVVASIPASVETIDYQAFANCDPGNIVEGETPEPFTDIVIPGTVKTVERYAFYLCSRVRSITIGAGVETIGNNAFCGLPLMAGAEVVLPSSVRSVGSDAFENTQIVSSGSTTEWKRNAVTLRVLNPDFELEENTGGSWLWDIEIDGKKYFNPFSVGQTIVAFAENSAGQPSWIKRMADAVAGLEDEHNPGQPAYTFEWMEEQAQVTGKVPVGASVTLFQNGVATEAKAAADGAFAVPALSATAATLQVRLDGYYDVVLTRAAGVMSGTWDVGELALDGFKKVPASRIMGIDVRKQVGVAEDGSPVRERVCSDSGLTFELRQGDRALSEGADADYVRQGLSLLLSQEVADAAQELTLVVTPDDSLKLGAGRAQAKPADGAFAVDLPAWGGMSVATKSAFSGSNDVMVFCNGVCVASGITDSAGELPFAAADLKAGSYTVIAVNHTSVDLQVPTLAAFERLHLAQGVQYVRADVEVADGNQTQVVLDVPVFDASAYLEQCGVKKQSGVVAQAPSVVVGVEAQVQVSYALDQAREGTVLLELPEVDFANVFVGANVDGEARQLDWTRRGDAVAVDMGNVQAADLYVRFAVRHAGARAVSAALELGDAVLPLGSANMMAYEAGILLASQEAQQVTGNAATVVAAPGTAVELEVGGKRFAAMCNKLGHAAVTYDLPANVFPGQRIALRAYVAGGEQPAATAYVTFTGGASVERFDVVNRGKTQRLIDGGKETGKSVTSLHHQPDKKNAYWTFAITLDARGLELDGEFILYVECLDGSVVPVTMKKRADDGESARFVGEYVDEAYLALLADYQASGQTGDVPLGDMSGLFLPSSYGVSNSLLASMVSLDANVVVKSIADQSAAKVDQFNTVLVGDLDERSECERQAVGEFCDELRDAARGDDEMLVCLDELMGEMGSSEGYLTGTAADESNTFWYQVLHGDGVLESDWFAELFGVEYDDPEVQEGVDYLRDWVVAQHNDFERYRKAVGDDLGVGDLSSYDSWDEVFIASIENNAEGVTVRDFDGDSAGFTEMINRDGYGVRTRVADDGSGFKAIINLPSGAQKTLEADFNDAAASNTALTMALDSVNIATDIDEYVSRVAFWAMNTKPVFSALKKFTSAGLRGHVGAFLQYQGTYRMPWKWAKNVPVYAGSLAAIGLGTSYVGASDALSNAADTETRLAEMRGEVERIEMLIRWYSGKSDIKNLQECIEALQNELFYAKRLVTLLESQRANEYADAAMGVVMGGVGAGATLFCPPAGAIIVSGIAYGYDASSSSVNTDRAKNLAWAQRMYERAVNERLEKCQPVEEELQRQREKNKNRLLEIDANLIIDPAGYVYEAVKSNVIEGVTAEVWRADAADGTGAVLWDAKAYEQENPLVTDADGLFGWFTPTGWYQVRFTKDGYEAAQTEWMAVPPVRTGLEIGLRTTVKPQVAGARAYADCVEMEFSQYMDASEVSVAELAVSGLGDGCTFEWVDSVEGADGRPVAKTLRAKPADGLAVGSAVQVGLAGAANYAGLAMDTWESGPLTVAVRPAELKLNVEQGYALVTGQQCEVVARVCDASGQPLAGQLVYASVESLLVAAFSSGLETVNAVTDADGVARFTLVGAATGLTDATVGVADSALSKTVDVRVSDERTRPARPVAQLGDVSFGAGAPKENYATVAAGTQLVISAEEGVTVYYTTDDTCPCIAGGSRVEYTGPVTVSANTRFRIAAFKAGLEEEYSERLNVTVTVTGGGQPVDPQPGGEDPDVPGGDGSDGGTGGGDADGLAGGGLGDETSGQQQMVADASQSGQAAGAVGVAVATGDAALRVALPIALAVVAAIAVAALACARMRGSRGRRCR